MSEELKNEKLEEMSEKITNICVNGGSDEELEEAIKESDKVIREENSLDGDFDGDTVKGEKSINDAINELASAVTKAINKKAETPKTEPKKKPFKLGLFGYLGLACVCKTVVEVARAVVDAKKPRR